VSRKEENAAFVCENCREPVMPLSNGSYRNHCPFCLWSKHVDVEPGDRRSTCGGLMKPIGVRYNSRKGFQIIHRCMICGNVSTNKAAERTVQPDDIDAISSLL
jgi:hypothetical protein